MTNLNPDQLHQGSITMKSHQIPRQFYILSVLLSLWFCSLSWFDSATKEGWAANIFAAQTLAVIACVIISRNWWSWAVIAIEGLCALYTVAVLRRWDVSSDIIYAYHGAFMLTCFIIELLIITISAGGDSVRIVCRRILPALGDRLRNFVGRYVHNIRAEVVR